MTGKTSSGNVKIGWLGQQFAKLRVRLFKRLGWPPFALLVVVLYWFWAASGIPTPAAQTVEKYGVYGDSFGRLTSFFTALGFGGLIITLLLQQRQIRKQDEAATHNLRKEAESRYEEVLFKLMDIYRQTLPEVSVRGKTGRDVLRSALDKVDAGLLDEGVNAMPIDLQGRWDSGTLTESDLARIDTCILEISRL